MDEGDEGEGQNTGRLTSYIYTDRPVYRPRQRVYFKGILRRLTEAGYVLLGGGKVGVTVEDPKVFTRPWNMSMMLYRHKEPNFQLLDYECYGFDFEKYYPYPEMRAPK